jgi:ABC-type transport system involved in multi-copper enzyme maturation permease subunit
MMIALIRIALLAGLRSKAPKALLLIALALVGMALLASSFSGRQPVTVGLDVGLSGLRMVLLLMTLVWVQLLLAQDIERKTLYFMLAYPYSRSQYLLSRFASLAILCAMATLLLGLLLWCALRLVNWEYAHDNLSQLDGRYALVMLGIWLDLLVVLAFAVLLCTLSTTPFLPLLLGLAFAFAARGLGPTFDYLRKEAYPDLSAAPWFAPVLEHAYAWLPDLSRLDWRPLALYALPVEPAAMGLAALMGLAYIVLLLAIAMQVFQRRDFT